MDFPAAVWLVMTALGFCLCSIFRHTTKLQMFPAVCWACTHPHYGRELSAEHTPVHIMRRHCLLDMHPSTSWEGTVCWACTHPHHGKELSAGHVLVHIMGRSCLLTMCPSTSWEGERGPIMWQTQVHVHHTTRYASKKKHQHKGGCGWPRHASSLLLSLH